MVKAILLEVKFPMYSQIGNTRSRNECIMPSFTTSRLVNESVAHACGTISSINGMSYQPKPSYSLESKTTRLPKGRIAYGNGVIVVPGHLLADGYVFSNMNRRGRITVNQYVSNLLAYTVRMYNQRYSQYWTVYRNLQETIRIRKLIARSITSNKTVTHKRSHNKP